MVLFAGIAAVTLTSTTGGGPASPAPSTTSAAAALGATPTPQPSPTSRATPPAWVDWQFAGATLTAPEAGIDHAEIHELRPNEIVTKTSTDASGTTVTYSAIEPDDKHTIAWDSQVVDGVRQPVGSVLSASAANTVYLYCHDYRDGTALCSTISDVTAPGDEITLETPTEVLTYAAVETFEERKNEISSDPRVTMAAPGRLLIITCNSAGERDTAGEPTVNTVLVFQLVASRAP